MAARWSPDRHRMLLRMLLPHQPLPERLVLYRPEDLPRSRRALYLPIAADGEFLYCGKVSRWDPDAVYRRYREHVRRDPVRGESWVRILVVPLPDHLTDREVAALEGRAAALVGWPREGRAWRRPRATA